jgi:hypothetical protein
VRRETCNYYFYRFFSRGDIVQLEPVFIDTVEYLCQELKKLNVTQPVAYAIFRATNLAMDTDRVRSMLEQFPGESDAAAKFDIAKLGAALQTAIANFVSKGDIVTNAHLSVYSIELGLLHDLRRLVARKKSTRIERVIAAGHRRASLCGPTGKVKTALIAVNEETLTKMRS